ncbi:MAG: adenylate/guanylate cyclase domain-containing protein [Flavobacteriales bacterium]|nr:adenylate/guanylate cyclase domain-containing protein [Flavobacteriales bacterium]
MTFAEHPAEEVAEELKVKGEAEASTSDKATILFTDFKGFTQMSELLSPQALVEELNTCFKAFDNIITSRGIEKIKTIGDAYMAAGGLPDPEQGSPADVLSAALEMQEFMQRHKAEREAQGKPYFEMRVGIHTGPVVAGIVGVKKFQYDIWGDTVEHGKPHGVIRRGGQGEHQRGDLCVGEERGDGGR